MCSDLVRPGPASPGASVEQEVAKSANSCPTELVSGVLTGARNSRLDCPPRVRAPGRNSLPPGVQALPLGEADRPVTKFVWFGSFHRSSRHLIGPRRRRAMGVSACEPPVVVGG